MSVKPHAAGLVPEATANEGDTVPSSLSGRLRRDPLLTLLSWGTDLIMSAGRVTGSLPPLPETDPEFFDVAIVGREVVARDQDVVALTFADVDGGQLPEWAAGAHLDVQITEGTVRQYSLCSDPADRFRYRIAVRLVPDGGGGSIAMHALSAGDIIRISKPRNAFPVAIGGYRQSLSRIRLIAGGIGITPIRSIATVLDRHGVDWSMIYCGRTRDSLAFLDELERFGDRVTLHLDDEQGIASAAELLGDLSDSPAVYACGPAPMISAIRGALDDRRDVELHYERFAPPPVVDGQPFTVTLASTGETVEVGAQETTLAALQAVRPDMSYSCRQGFCRSCAIVVTAGEPDHRSTALTPAETAEGYFLPCVSRACGPLTVDL